MVGFERFAVVTSTGCYRLAWTMMGPATGPAKKMGLENHLFRSSRQLATSCERAVSESGAVTREEGGGLPRSAQWMS